jgi:predicted DNA-binding transcriptional regulator YafY
MANDSQKIQQLRRILLLFQLVKTKPVMSSKELQEELGVNKSKYNRDRKFMESRGIKSATLRPYEGISLAKRGSVRKKRPVGDFTMLGSEVFGTDGI